VKKKICLAVLSVHLSFVLWTLFFHVAPPKRLMPKHLTVKTFSPKVQTVATVASPAPKKPPAPAPKKPPAPRAPAKKLQAPPPVVVKRPPVMDKKPAAVAQKPKKSPIPQELLQELEESIAKIDEKRDKLYRRKEPEAPAAIEILRIDALEIEKNTSDLSYAETLVVHLKQTLNLPDYGEVKIQLTLGRDGSVEKLVIVKSESDKNKRYLEDHLPRLKFPSLNKDTHTFVLTFCNEV
jgi:outer membrane biosynthesis protein TonB